MDDTYSATGDPPHMGGGGGAAGQPAPYSLNDKRPFDYEPRRTGLTPTYTSVDDWSAGGGAGQEGFGVGLDAYGGGPLAAALDLAAAGSTGGYAPPPPLPPSFDTYPDPTFSYPYPSPPQSLSPAAAPTTFSQLPAPSPRRDYASFEDLHSLDQTVPTSSPRTVPAPSVGPLVHNSLGLAGLGSAYASRRRASHMRPRSWTAGAGASFASADSIPSSEPSPSDTFSPTPPSNGFEPPPTPPQPWRGNPGALSAQPPGSMSFMSSPIVQPSSLAGSYASITPASPARSYAYTTPASPARSFTAVPSEAYGHHSRRNSTSSLVSSVGTGGVFSLQQVSAAAPSELLVRQETPISPVQSERGFAPVVELNNLDLEGNVEASSTMLKDFSAIIQPHLTAYLSAPNRLQHGESVVALLNVKTAQKSYGSEKRYIASPPQVILLGKHWYPGRGGTSDSSAPHPPAVAQRTAAPARAIISLGGDLGASECALEWTTKSGEQFDPARAEMDPPVEGRGVARHLHVSDPSDRRKTVQPVAEIALPGPAQPVLGAFLFPPIHIISKASKQRKPRKNEELCIHHGSLVSLFNRTRSQTSSTRYLSVSGTKTCWPAGSDGQTLTNDPAPDNARFAPETNFWDAFIIWLYDPRATANNPPLPPPPGYPAPPQHVLPFDPSGAPTVLRHNHVVLLQSFAHGVVSPPLILRRAGKGTTVLGGGTPSGLAQPGVAEVACSPGEVLGEAIVQLNKVGLELLDSQSGQSSSPGRFLSCLDEAIGTHTPRGRKSSLPRRNDRLDHSVLSPTSPTAPGFPPDLAGPPQPQGYSPPDFEAMYGQSYPSVAPAPPIPDPSPPSDGSGLQRRRRRLSSSAAATGSSAANAVPIASKAAVRTRRRVNSLGSGSPNKSAAQAVPVDLYAEAGSTWTLDVGESALWTLSGADVAIHRFFIPDLASDGSASTVPLALMPCPSIPIAPFPVVLAWQPSPLPPPPTVGDNARMIVLVGHGFAYTDTRRPSDYLVFFGTDTQSPMVEFRSSEELLVVAPRLHAGQSLPITLVRRDCCIFPTELELTA